MMHQQLGEEDASNNIFNSGIQHFWSTIKVDFWLDRKKTIQFRWGDPYETLANSLQPFLFCQPLMDIET